MWVSTILARNISTVASPSERQNAAENIALYLALSDKGVGGATLEDIESLPGYGFNPIKHALLEDDAMELKTKWPAGDSDTSDPEDSPTAAASQFRGCTFA